MLAGHGTREPHSTGGPMGLSLAGERPAFLKPNSPRWPSEPRPGVFPRHLNQPAGGGLHSAQATEPSRNQGQKTETGAGHGEHYSSGSQDSHPVAGHTCEPGGPQASEISHRKKAARSRVGGVQWPGCSHGAPTSRLPCPAWAWTPGSERGVARDREGQEVCRAAGVTGKACAGGRASRGH